MFETIILILSFICFAISLVACTKTDESVHKYLDAMDRYDEARRLQYNKDLLERNAELHEEDK